MLVDNVNDLQNMQNNLSGSYALGKNIDASATSTWNTTYGFAPIGSATANFSSSFNGLDHSITGLTINRSFADMVGLFGGVGQGGVIKNVSLIGAAVQGHWDTGGLAGWSAGTITNSIGGLVGENNGTMNNKAEL